MNMKSMPPNRSFILSNRIKSDLTLLLVAAVWGSGFIAQRMAAPNMSVFFFNGARFLLGVFILLPIIRFKLTITREQASAVILAGFLLFAAGGLQQAGMITTTAGNAGFITGLYVVIIPFMLVVFWKQKIAWTVWLAAFLSAIGILMLSTGGKLKIGSGDLLEFGGAILWALHVIVVSRAVEKMNALQFAIGQFLVCALLNFLIGFLFEPAQITGMTQYWQPIVYKGIFSVGVGFTLQAGGQRNAPATDAAIILSMESVFAAIFGFLFLTEVLTFPQILGAGLIMSAIVLAQIKAPQKAPD